MSPSRWPSTLSHAYPLSRQLLAGLYHSMAWQSIALKVFQSLLLCRNDTSFSFNNQLYSNLALSSWSFLYLPVTHGNLAINTPGQLVLISIYFPNRHCNTIQSLINSCRDIHVTVLFKHLAFSPGTFTPSKQFTLS